MRLVGGMRGFLRFAIVLSFAWTAFASFGEGEDYRYLYWMLDDAKDSNPHGVEFTYAKVRVDNTSQYLDVGMLDGVWDSKVVVDCDNAAVSDDTPPVGTSIQACWADLAAYAGDGSASFLLELYAADDTLIRSSRSVSYGELAGAKALAAVDKTTGMIETDGVVPFASWSVVPEPTSGLLTLFGLAALALRRKRIIGSPMKR